MLTVLKQEWINEQPRVEIQSRIKDPTLFEIYWVNTVILGK